MKHAYCLTSFLISIFFLQLSLCVYPVFAQVPISPGETITQNFTIGTSGTATLPTGWRVDKQENVRSVGSWVSAGTSTERAASANIAFNAPNGIYNFGSTAQPTDRAVGFISTGTGTSSGNLYVQLYNTGTSAISTLSLSYMVEKYRRGTNAAGFRIQLYYSRDGINWVSAGTDFATAFEPDDVRTGYADAPGDSSAVNAQFLTLDPSEAIGPGQSIYLAWNYSVISGTTTSNAQALGIDNVSVTALEEASNTISAPVVSDAPFTLPDCESTQSVGISFGTTGTFADDNVFTVQLSDAEGSFDNPVTIGSGPENVDITIPARTPPGESYRLRIFSSNPYTLSEPSEPFTINSPQNCESLANHYFRSAGTGPWHSTSTWQSSEDSVAWIPATLIPNSAANTVSILEGHAVTIQADLEIDQLVIEEGAQLIRTGGAFTLNNGIGHDMLVRGLFAYQGGEETTYATGSSVLVPPAGVVEIRNNASPAGGLAPSHYGTSQNFIYRSEAIFAWNVSAGGTLSALNQTFFPNTLGATTDVPIFSVRAPLTFSGSPIVNGLTRVEAGVVLSLSGSPNKTLRNGLVGQGNITQASSSGPVLITGSAAQLGGTGTITLNTNGMRIAAGNTTALTSNKGINGGALQVLNNGVLNTVTFSLTGNGGFTLAEGATLQTAHENGVGGTIQLTGTKTYNSNANFTFNSSVSQNTNFPEAVSSARIVSIQNEGIATTVLNKSLQINGLAGISGAFNMQSHSFTGPGGFNLNQNATLISTHPEGVAGNVQLSGENNFSGTASYTFTGTANQTTGLLNNITTASRFVIDKPIGILTLNKSLGITTVASVAGHLNMQSFSFTGPGEFSMQEGSTLQSAHPQGIEGNVQVSGLTYFYPLANYAFTGDVPQQTGFPEDVASANRLTINNTGGEVVLNTPFTVNEVLSLVNGQFTTSMENMLTLTGTATVTDASAASFVNGPMTKNGSSAFEFPVGKGGIWAPISISDPGSGATSFRAEYFDAAPPDITETTGALANVSAKEYWRLERIASTPPAGNVNVTLHWKNGERSGITSPAGLSVAYYNEGANNPQWQSRGNGGTSGNVSAGSITSQQSFNSFGLVTFGSDSEGNNPLPVTFISFTGRYLEGNAILEWSTASELNNLGFEVERSLDGLLYEKIGFVQGNGTSTARKDYTFTDRNQNRDAYYRLKQLDTDDAFEYSKVVFVRASQSLAADFSVYPNPVVNRVALESSYSEDVLVDMQLLSIDGKEISRLSGTVDMLNNHLNSAVISLKAGVYLIHLQAPSGPVVLRLVKQ